MTDVGIGGGFVWGIEGGFKGDFAIDLGGGGGKGGGGCLISAMSQFMLGAL